MNTNYAFVYYLANQDLFSDLVVSIESLKATSPQYPIHVLLGCDVINKNIETFLTQVMGVIVSYSNVPFSLSNLAKYDDGSYSLAGTVYAVGRIDAWILTQYEKIVLLGVDTYIVQNIDELFTFPNGSMANHGNEKDLIPNGDVVILEPNIDMYFQYVDMLISWLRSDEDNIVVDQFFFDYWFSWKQHPECHLEYKYNAITRYLDSLVAEEFIKLDDIKIFHMHQHPRYIDLDICNINTPVENGVLVNYFLYFDSVINKYKNTYSYLPFRNTFWGSKE